MLIISFSGNAENSLTLKSLEVLEHHPSISDVFEKEIVRPSTDILSQEWFSSIRTKMESADIVVWAVSPYHMNMPSHMLRFFGKCRSEGVMLNNVNSFFQTNIRVCDHFLSDSLERNIRSISKHYVPGLSYSSYDIITKRMQLYLITQPDRPAAKKGFFHKNEISPASFSDGEGMRNAISWYKMLKAYAAYYQNETAPILSKPEKAEVLFIDMDETTDGRSSSLTENVSRLKAFYKDHGIKVDEIAQRDYNVRPCDGCKICYGSKVCKIKDDFSEYEKRISSANILIYYGKCEYGLTSSLSKRFIDRGIHRGLMPNDGKLPWELENYIAEGCILDCADAESYCTIKSYHMVINTFGIVHDLGVYAEGITPSSRLDEMGVYSLMVKEFDLLPQRNFYSAAVGAHFADLSKSIPGVIPDEGKYYKKAGAFDEVPVEENAHVVMPETYKLAAKMRLTPYNKVIESLDSSKS
ncbi:MAG: flavodoxin family protein [Clostridiales bacterium]|nr:flavodoxin family protein [Clostridiales bacterium]